MTRPAGAPSRSAESRSAALRAELDHPVIDSDGHLVEIMAVFMSYVHDAGHGKLLEETLRRTRSIEDLTMAERREAGICPNSWHVPSKTEYYATVTSPKRYYERMDEAGIDFMVLHPTAGNGILSTPDDEARVTLCRLYNEWVMEMYRPYLDRFAPTLLVPMHTPEEAVAALEHNKELGGKVGMMTSHVHRPHPGEEWPPNDPLASVRIDQWETHGWVDTYGIDSLYDYDPVWAKAVELGMPLVAHTAGIGTSDRASISNFVFNQVGHFAASGSALAKSLFLGGVTDRFPGLRVALQEGGAAVGVQTYVSLVANWQKRGGQAIANLNPELLDKDLLVRLLVDDDARLAEFTPQQLTGQIGGGMTRVRDDYVAANITSVADIHDRFITPFAWGCEADDPLVGVAFDPRVTPDGSLVRAFFASDLGHWDVADFDEPLEEAFELVEKGILDVGNLRDFVFANAVEFYSAMNPEFFVGTSVEREAAALLAG
jgi:predicted TIM-barrel fold metal-dependent hydrolase